MRPFPRRPHLGATLAMLEGRVESTLAKIPVDFGGGCSVSKALTIGRLLVENRATLALDVGVYRGRSFFPMAIAFSLLGQGTAVGIDPFTAFDAMQHDEHLVRGEPLDRMFLREWTASHDWDATYASVLALLESEGLTRWGRILRERSSDAAHRFRPGTIGLVHIDANHDANCVDNDVASYLPLVKPGGHVVLDDISWESSQHAYDHLRSEARLITEIVDDANDYAIFQLS